MAPWALGLSLALLAGTASAATYFVDGSSPQCSDTGPGTSSQPYCTINAAVQARARAGNTIVVQPGTYRESIIFPASGTAAAPIVIRANAPGVVIDGADDLSQPGSWTPVTGDVWLASSVTWSPAQVFADGARLTASTGSPGALAAGTFRYVAGAGLYANAGGGDPGLHGARVGHRANAFVLTARTWITVDGFQITRTEDRSIRLSSGANDDAILNCRITFSNEYGINVSGSARVWIANNVITDHNDHGIALTSGATACLIENNESARNAVPGTRSANGLYMYGASSNVIRRNRWHDNQDTGQHMQSGSNDNLSYDNVSWNNGDHGYDHLGASGNVHFNDVAYANYKDGFSMEGTSPGTQLTNCIAVDNGLTTNEFDLWVDNTSTSGFVSNDNIFWNSTAQPPFKYVTTPYASLAAYQAASGQDSRTLQADPRFVNPAAGDFRLLAGSPAIDNGNASSPDWPVTDAGGYARVNDPTRPDAGLGPITWSDRGALEYQPAGAPPVAALAAGPWLGTAPSPVTLDASGSSDPQGGPLTYRFDFGDGVTAGPQASPVIAHTYAAGTYAPVVTVVNAAGLEGRDTATVIANQRPLASLSGSPLSGHTQINVSFSASASNDADGSIVWYTFDFGDGTTLGPRTSPATTHVYTLGHWQPSVTVIDDRGTASLPSAPVVVNVTPPNQPPVAALTLSPLSGHAPLPVTADASGSSDADGQVVSYRFNFGDGTIIGPQPAATATHALAQGPRTVSVVVTDNEGATGNAVASLTVSAPDRAPVVVSPASVTASEGGTVTVAVTASDPDGEPLTSLAADLSRLPAGNDAVFTPAPGFGSGQLAWHPTFADSGSYLVSFVGANAMADTVSTLVSIQNVDRAPVVTAPATARAAAGRPLALGVSAGDPDGDAIATLTANLASLPAGDTFAFTPAADARSGVLDWTPAARDSGTYALVFTATNALSGSASTQLTITGPNQPPVAALAATPKSGNEPLMVNASAAGSSDPEGAALTYRFDFGDGAAAGPQASASTSHRYAAGTWRLLATVTDSAGAVSRDSASITVAVSGPGLNLVGNPSFEWSTAGWAPTSGGTLNIDPGGFDGARCLRVRGPANLNPFGIDDSPNWVAATDAAGTRYRFSAWVRASLSRGSVRLQAREFSGAGQVGTTMLSAPVVLASGWQPVTAEFVSRAAGSTLDLQVLDQPVTKSEVFQVDDVAIAIVPPPTSRTPLTTNDPPPGGASGHGQGGSLPIPAAPDSVPERFAVSVETGARSPALALALTRPGPLRIEVFDLAGRRVRAVVDEAWMAPGLHSFTLDGHGEDGERLGNGVYFYRVQAPERSVTGRFVIVR